VPSLVEVSPPVSAALRSGAPVVALESTIISHGLPRPGNLDAAREFEAILAGQGVTAATIALVDGVPRVGLTPDELERIATDESVVKVSSRDIAIAVARKVTGGTTVAATSVLAARAGIRVFATGGLGGVHRGASETFDESADLTVLSRTPITVVSAGVKSILDIPATLERLETLGVAVVGYRTSRFPAFWLSDSGCDLDWRADSPAEIADIMAAREAFGEQSALLVAHGRPGFYFRVIEEGEVEAGDLIVKVASGAEQMSVAQVNALLYLPGHRREDLERALRIPALSAGWKDSFQSLLQRARGAGAW